MNPQPNDREARVNAAIAEYLHAVDSGEQPDRAAFLQRHAELADELAAFFADQDRLQDLCPAPLPGPPTASAFPTAGTAAGSEGCPRCPDTESDGPADGLPEEAAGRVGRYRLEAEIARGGMGVVFRAHDADLGRRLAVKVLQRRHKDDPALARRFLEEAQVCGQLQHPGVPPVHELGSLPDGRPFFAMKLVRGQTLAGLLAARDGPADDLPRFLHIFEQVCQTVAYAHSKGILHRDLKPANVMVGSFGEVQVMDWGLAKAIRPASQASPGRQLPDVPASTVFSTRAGVPGASTQAGTVLGTLAYMPPEQARGQVDFLDERADVFALGATLCEILTGRPPYQAATREELLRQAAAGELAQARQRLAACVGQPGASAGEPGASAPGERAELVRLALSCLEFEPAKRPPDAGAVAQAVAAYRAGVEERARRAEVERAAAEARAEEAKAKARAERRARRLTVGLAAAVLLLAAAGGAVAWVVQQQHADAVARQRQASEKVRDALGRVRAKLQAGRQANDLALLADAQADADRVQDIAAGAGDEARQEAAALRQQAADALATARKDNDLAAALLDVAAPREAGSYQRGEGGGMMALAQPSLDEQFAAAFRRWGGGHRPRPAGRGAGETPGPARAGAAGGGGRPGCMGAGAAPPAAPRGGVAAPARPGRPPRPGQWPAGAAPPPGERGLAAGARAGGAGAGAVAVVAAAGVAPRPHRQPAAGAGRPGGAGAAAGAGAGRRLAGPRPGRGG